jgi:hypothetical protein
MRTKLKDEKESGLLSPQRALILAQFDPGSAREALKPGEYESSFAADVIGKIKIGEDSEQQISIPWKQVALMLLEGQSPKGALKVLKAAVESPKESPLEGKLKELASEMLGKRPIKGRVTGSCLVRIREED